MRMAPLLLLLLALLATPPSSPACSGFVAAFSAFPLLPLSAMTPYRRLESSASVAMKYKLGKSPSGATENIGGFAAPDLESNSNICDDDVSLAEPEFATAITSYLGDSSHTPEFSTIVSAGAVGPYFDAFSESGVELLSTGSQGSGSGPASYLHRISEACDVDQPTEKCYVAISSYLDALSAGETEPDDDTDAAVVSHIAFYLGAIKPDLTARAAKIEEITVEMECAILKEATFDVQKAEQTARALVATRLEMEQKECVDTM